MLGGVQQLRPGWYRGTPIESILPVTLDPAIGARARARCGRRAGQVGEHGEAMGHAEDSRRARRGVRCRALLEPGDRLGLLAFDGAPRGHPLQDVPGGGQLQRILDEVRPGGGTRILPALAEAGAMLQAFHGGRRQIILVTDGRARGETLRAPRGGSRRTGSPLRRRGRRGCDLPLLRELALAGGGRMEIARDAGRLSGASGREIAVARGPLIHEGARRWWRALIRSSGGGNGALPPCSLRGDSPAGIRGRPPRAETGEPSWRSAPSVWGGRPPSRRTRRAMGGEWRRWTRNAAPSGERPELAAARAAGGTDRRATGGGRDGLEARRQATSAEGDYLDGRTLQAHLQRAEHPETTLPLHQRVRHV